MVGAIEGKVREDEGFRQPFVLGHGDFVRRYLRVFTQTEA